MNLLIISTSQRKSSQSNKVARYLAETITDFDSVDHIDLHQQNLPMWDGEDATKFDLPSDWKIISKQLMKADAIILITPEWGGTASPLLKNFLMMCEITETGHKPALLISVVNGISGAYPIAELRMNAFSNNKLVAIPDHLIIRNVEDILNSVEIAINTSETENTLTERDVRIRHRIGYSLHTLIYYAETFKKLRVSLSENIYPDEHLYSYGM
jgi:NAD(P)H-dependent FMN reductase